MKKTISFILIAVVLCGLLCSCQPDPMPEGYVEQEVIDKTHEFVGYLHERNFEAAAAMFNTEKMKDFGADKLKEKLTKHLDDLGEFEKYTTTLVYGSEDKEGNKYAACMAVVGYKKMNYSQYELTFDRDLKIIALSIR